MATTLITGRRTERIGALPCDPAATGRLGMCFALLGISMLFTGLTSAYIVGQGTSAVWPGMPMPRILLVNTAVLAVSGFTMEMARRAARPPRWLSLTLVLGLVFLAGQILAWRQLSSAGIYLDTNPRSSFFYVLTALHGLHVAGGIAALGWLAAAGVQHRRRIAAAALYWHFMGGLWVYLLALLFVWR